MLLSQSDGDHCACKLSLQQSKRPKRFHTDEPFRESDVQL